HGELPSFPTRRSSDLRSAWRWPCANSTSTCGKPAKAKVTIRNFPPATDPPSFRRWTSWWCASGEPSNCLLSIKFSRRKELLTIRSEEHTSELQSRENL